jgi:biopolymer transport protein ExbD
MKIKLRKSQAQIPSMAMGDIAFNLLIFFVILARAQDDSHLQWTPSKVEEIERGKQSRVTVVIDNKNSIFLNGQEVSSLGLAEDIERQLQGVQGQDRVVQFKIHRKSPVRIIEPVFEAIGKAGADVFIIVEKE